MNAPGNLERLRFLVKIVQRESLHLRATDARLFASPLTPERLQSMEADVVMAERLDAFVARFARLQDTVGDKFVPALLQALQEPIGAVIDNLDRAERLGWIVSADGWIEARRLRNQMIHEYVDDLSMLASNLQAGHRYVPVLLETAQRLIDETARRGWA
ncbi:hypothetical protein [Metallibacterium scheffleri]|uniref:DUF86 domain-containing protein n=1 Tax=Metallibacterium scheffleri TaxID=993689 RepID=A0A4S3KPY2_9GAMM|nr:hypothetical protein [Metallibacterium scheffleri]THD11029.1 hypothetical protein B1806_05725 [Metallibacterium scheffleri]